MTLPFQSLGGLGCWICCPRRDHRVNRYHEIGRIHILERYSGHNHAEALEELNRDNTTNTTNIDQTIYNRFGYPGKPPPRSSHLLFTPTF
jgi:hypothetical protein